MRGFSTEEVPLIESLDKARLLNVRSPQLFMKILDYFNKKKFTYDACGTKPNMFNANPVCFAPDEKGVKEFNTVYKLLKESSLNELWRTPSGGIVISVQNRFAWDFRHNSSGAIVTVYLSGRLYVFKLGHWGVKKENTLNATVAFNKFYNKCIEFGINLEDYSIKNGEDIKKLIPKPYISMRTDLIDKTIKGVHHIDFHNSYPAGLANTHPEFRPVIEFFYNERTIHPEYKSVLNISIGYMQSMNLKTVKARWAHLSKDAITDNNNRIDRLVRELIDNDYEIIGLNTDGIWYKGGKPYHGEGEGPGLGEWCNDHIYCQFRAKSAGCYEFIEKGKYYPIVRGLIAYDSVLPREKWKRGDIYKGEVKILELDEENGYIIKENEYEI